MAITKQRESNLELYRIIIMILIVAHHYVVNSGLIEVIEQDPTSSKSLYLYVFGMWGKTGINCFILITGYFMCKSKITLRKFTKLLLWVYFYRIVFYLVFCVSGYIDFNVLEFFRKLLPIYDITDGFVSCFLVFFLTIPFLNILIQNMSKRQHTLLLVLSLFIYSIWAKMPYISVKMNYVIWFDALYLISSYIRIYSIFDGVGYKKWGWLTLLSILLAMSSVIGIIIFNKPQNAYYLVSDSNAILAVVVSVCAFMYFKSYPMKYHKWINSISASTFGVLLIHANSDNMRQWLWKDTLNNVSIFNEGEWIYMHSIVGVLGIFIICTIIDQLRLKYLEIPLFKTLDKYMEKRNNKFIFEWT